MSRFLAACVIILLLFTGFVFFKNIDNVALFKIGDYILESSILTLVGFLIVAIILLVLFLKTTFLILDLPYLIKRKWRLKKEQKTNQAIINSSICLISKDKNKAYQMVSRLEPSAVNQKYQPLLILIKAKTSTRFDEKIANYKLLLDHKEYEFYALKGLAKIFFKEKSYVYAQEYASKALDFNNTDEKILKILCCSYGETKSWDKFDDAVANLIKSKSELIETFKEDITSFYVKAAKEMLDKGENQKAEKYIQTALRIDPVCLEALNLFITANLVSKDTQVLKDILQEAFKAKPSLPLVEIYARVTNLSSEEIYQDLATLAPVENNIELFLAISAYLNLQNNTNHRYVNSLT